jgi:hypothetical protein
MKRATIIAVVVACAGLGACSNTLDPHDSPNPPHPTPPPHPIADPQPTTTTVSLQLQNGGMEAAYVYQGCLIDYKVTSLADPSVPINRVEGCLCMCGQSACSTCGQCYAGPREIPAGGQITESWVTANVTTENGGVTGSCQRLNALPAGSYRIEVPVYVTHAEADAKVLPRVITQVFTLPAPNDTVTIQVAASP